jgi:hypothetical protein
VDAITGEVLDWNPGADGAVQDLVVAGEAVVVGGAFRTVDGKQRSRLAAVHGISGRALDWIADANSVVYALAVLGDTLFAAGSFSVINGIAHAGLAAIDLASGEALPWDHGTDGGAGSLEVWDQTLYVGGGFHRVGVSPASGLAAISLGPRTPVPPPPPSSTALAWIAPNPVLTNATVRFALASAGRVSLSVFDLQGRVVSMLRELEFPAGVHEVPLAAGTWSEGFYFLRLEAGGMVATRKFVVIR